MSIDNVKLAHAQTQRKIEFSARDRHLQSKGKWEEEKGLTETILDLDYRIAKIEIALKEIIDGIDSSRSSDDTRSDDVNKHRTIQDIDTGIESSIFNSDVLHVADHAFVR